MQMIKQKVERACGNLESERPESGKLALAADIDRTYIASVESGKRNISIVNLEKLIIALDTSFAEFFEGM